MKKIACVLLTLVLLCAFAVPAFAVDGVFTPSVGYKDGPEIEDSTYEGEDEDLGECLVVTSVSQAQNNTTDIPEEKREQLLEVYEALSNNTLQLPEEYGDMVVRDLIDVSFVGHSGDHDHEHEEEKNATVQIRFALGVPVGVEVGVMSYIDGAWVMAENIVNNGDGTVTCTLNTNGPVAFCVPRGTSDLPADTGDAVGRMLWFWIALMAASSVALTGLVLSRRKFLR